MSLPVLTPAQIHTLRGVLGLHRQPAKNAVRLTVEGLQHSALDLLNRILACGAHRDNRCEDK